MPEKSIEEIKTEIHSKRTADKKKLKVLTKVAGLGLLIRILLFVHPSHFGGLVVELLWIPLILLILALPFYGFERLLNKIKKD